MRKFLLGVLLLPAVVVAQPVTVEKPVVCSDLKTVIETVSGPKWGEQPIWSGKDETSRYVLTSNHKTKTWTMIQFNDKIACIIGIGDSASHLNFNKAKSL